MFTQRTHNPWKLRGESNIYPREISKFPAIGKIFDSLLFKKGIRMKRRTTINSANQNWNCKLSPTKGIPQLSQLIPRDTRSHQTVDTNEIMFLSKNAQFPSLTHSSPPPKSLTQVFLGISREKAYIYVLSQQFASHNHHTASILSFLSYLAPHCLVTLK